MTMSDDVISVEVAYALPTQQRIMALKVPVGTNIYDAVIQSGITNVFPQINPDSDPMGIFGKGVRDPKSTELKEGDRVEIYRPLIADPKEARARRAEKMKAQKAAEEKVDTEAAKDQANTPD
jgi:putative ubiquitin-RnfH superfamily antitoxin RatB of RatAB toxin-antitoxin module